MLTENTRGEEETEKMRLLLANLFFARVFFVQHNLSYEFDDFLKDPDNTDIGKILEQGNPPIVEPQVGFYKKILGKYKKLTDLQRTLMNTGLPFVGGNWGLYGQSHIAHIDEVRKFFPDLEYLAEHYDPQVGLLGEKENYFQKNKNTRQLSLFDKGDARGKIEVEEMRKMYADLFFLKQFFIDHDMSYEFDDFLRDPTNTHIDARIKTNPDIGSVKEEIHAILEKYRQLSTTKRNIIYAGWPYVGWRLNDIPQEASFREALMQAFPTPSFLLQHYNNMPKGLHMRKELEKSFFVMYSPHNATQVAWINEDRIRGENEKNKMRLLLANIHFLRDFFKKHGMHYAFEAFLTDPTDTKIYQQLEKHPIPNLQHNIPVILEKYKNLGQTQRQIINGGLPFVGWDIRSLPHNNIRKEIIAIFPGPGYLQNHHQKINKPLKEEQERQQILEAQERKKAEEQRKALEAQRLEKEQRVQKERRRQQAIEAQHRQAAEAQRQAQSREQEERQRKAYEAQRLQQRIEAQQKRVVEISESNSEFEKMCALLCDIDKVCQNSENKRTIAENFWDNPTQQNTSRMRSIVLNNIPIHECVPCEKAINYYQELVSTIEHLTSKQAQEPKETNILAALKAKRKTILQYAKGPLTAILPNSQKSLSALANITKTAARDKKEKDLLRPLLHYSLELGYLKKKKNWAQTIRSYDTKRKQQIQFIDDLKTLLKSDIDDMKPFEKATILQSAYTLLLQELKGETRATRWLGTKSRLESVITEELTTLATSFSFLADDPSHKNFFNYVQNKDEFKKDPNLERLKKFKQLNETSHPKPKYK